LFIHCFAIEGAKVGIRGKRKNEKAGRVFSNHLSLTLNNGIPALLDGLEFNSPIPQLTQQKQHLTEYSYKPVTFSW
jgi:hypothetical protein